MSCEHCNHQPSSVCQTLEELDFERGIWYAALYNDVDRVQHLLAKKTDVDVPDHGGYTALHYAARAGHAEMCRVLLAAGANVNASTRSGQSTALHRAALLGRENVVELLLQHGADPKKVDIDQKTFLHKAVESGQSNFARKIATRFPELLDAKDVHGKISADYDKAAIFSLST